MGEGALETLESKKKANEKFDPSQVCTAIRETRGLIVHAADRLGCSPQTVYRYVKEYPDVAAELKDARERMKDVAESSLYTAIEERQAWAVCFYLKTQARDRGYVERQELTGADGAPLFPEFERALERAYADTPDTDPPAA